MRTVLILEDNPGSRMALRSLLEDSGYRVLEAADEEAAIRACLENSAIDLLVTDVILRSSHGPETARRLTALHPGMPILFISGHPLEALLNRGLLETSAIDGHGAFLQKPLALKPFLEMIERLLGPVRPTVLVVDDEADVRSILRRYLERHEFAVLDAGDGPAALDVAGRHDGDIHLLITDIVMPGMNGWELAGRLLAERPALKVLYMSGYCQTEAAADRLDSTRAAFLHKPFAMGALLAKIEQMLEERGRPAAG